MWTRRDTLKASAAAGVAGLTLPVVGIERALNPPSSGTPSSGPLPSPASAVSGAPAASSSPGASAAPGPRQAYRTRPEATPPVVSVSHGPAADSAAGLIFLTPANCAGADGPLIVDAQGEPVWIRPGGGSAATNFRVIQFRGKPALTWWEGANNNGIGSGQFAIADESYRVVKRITGAKGAKADLHELLLTPTGTAIFFIDLPITVDRTTGKQMAGPGHGPRRPGDRPGHRGLVFEPWLDPHSAESVWRPVALRIDKVRDPCVGVPSALDGLSPICGACRLAS